MIFRWLLLALGLFAFSHAALAQEATTSGQLISIDDFGAMIQSLKATARTMSPFFIDEGAGLLSIFFGIGLFILLLKLFFGPGDPGVKANLFLLVFKAGLVAAMLASWVNYGVGPNQETVAPIGQASGTLSSYRMPISVEDIAVTSFDSLVDGMFDRFGGGGGKEKVFNVIGQSWSMMWQASEQRDRIRDQARVQLGTLERLVAWMEQFGDKIITFLAALFVAFLALVLMALYLFVVYCGDIMAWLAMFMGPLMIPGLVFGPLEFLFNSWLKAMISAGFFKIIAAWLALITMKTVEQIQIVANRMYATAAESGVSGSAGQQAGNAVMMDAGFALSIVMTVLYMMFAIFLMWQVWYLTEMLMRGTSSNAVNSIQRAGEAAYKKSTS